MSAPSAPSGSLLSADTEADALRRTRLRRMKAVAAGALVLAAVVYIITQLIGPVGWLGYLHAAAEASMVGALADWFAVTALFRRPLGLPIPHTAIIPPVKTSSARAWAISSERTFCGTGGPGQAAAPPALPGAWAAGWRLTRTPSGPTGGLATG